jgi:hypothetical protein
MRSEECTLDHTQAVFPRYARSLRSYNSVRPDMWAYKSVNDCEKAWGRRKYKIHTFNVRMPRVAATRFWLNTTTIYCALVPTKLCIIKQSKAINMNDQISIKWKSPEQTKYERGSTHERKHESFKRRWHEPQHALPGSVIGLICQGRHTSIDGGSVCASSRHVP